MIRKLWRRLKVRLTMTMRELHTCELVDELIKREGVTEYILSPESQVTRFTFNGPARILEVID